MDSYNYIKVVVVGDIEVGKTRLLKTQGQKQFNHFSYSQKYEVGYQTQILESFQKEFNYKEKSFRIGLFDTTGEEVYNQLRTLIYQNTDIFLIVFQVANKSSFQNAFNSWLPEVQYHAPKSLQIIIGNDMHLREMKKNCVSYKEAETLALMKGVTYIECNSDDYDAIKSIFEMIYIKRIEITKQHGQNELPAQRYQRGNSCILM